MSLATRCTSCQTTFRVVQDQLKVSEGWVRCGRCESVFNALEELFDLGSDDTARREIAAPLGPSGASSETAFERTRPIVPDSASAALASPTDAASPVRSNDIGGANDGGDDDDPPARVSSFDELLADPIDAHIFRNRRADGDRPLAAKVRERDRNEFSDARFDSDLFADPATADDDPDLDDATATGAGDLPLESSAASHQPDFLRRAERRARWRSAPMRATLLSVAAIATAALMLQVTHHFRDRIAAQWPAAAPALATWCGIAGCTIEAPREIDALSVESTALSKAIGRDGYILAVALRSRAPHALRLPWVDLALTDANGRLVARRALSPRDFGAPDTIAAAAELPLQLTLDAGATRIAGYTVELFYP